MESEAGGVYGAHSLLLERYAEDSVLNPAVCWGLPNAEVLNDLKLAMVVGGGVTMTRSPAGLNDPALDNNGFTPLVVAKALVVVVIGDDGEGVGEMRPRDWPKVIAAVGNPPSLVRALVWMRVLVVVVGAVPFFFLEADGDECL